MACTDQRETSRTWLAIPTRLDIFEQARALGREIGAKLKADREKGYG
jgi:hypothetical protein